MKRFICGDSFEKLAGVLDHMIIDCRSAMARNIAGEMNAAKTFVKAMFT